MLRFYKFLKIIKVIATRVTFIIKYVICNYKSKRWFCWYFSERTNKGIIIIDIKALHDTYRTQNAFFEHYEKDFNNQLKRLIRVKYLEYSGMYGDKISKVLYKKERIERELRNIT